jgi:hypothetical protein
MFSSGRLLLALAILIQVPADTQKIRVIPPPLPSVPAAHQSMMGLRILDVRPDGVFLLGSACPTAPFLAYTAAHVADAAKGQLIAVPNHGYRGGDVIIHVHVVWKDKKHDIASIVPDSPSEDSFPTWFVRGPIPEAGAEVRGILILPSEGNLAVPAFGTFYGEGDGWLWSSQATGPGSSGSCLLDDQDRAVGIISAAVSWGNDESVQSNMPRASVSVRIPD